MNLEWRHGFRPNDSISVVVNFHDRAHYASRADTIRTHYYRLALPFLVSEFQIKGFRKSGAKPENISHLDCLFFFNFGITFRAKIATTHQSNFFVLAKIAFRAKNYRVLPHR